ncbi:MAG: hypothetical protein ACTSYI_18015 [Promethearchaeota archaeon]
MPLFILDTCFVSHAQELKTHHIWDIGPSLASARLCVTEAVNQEIIHFGLDTDPPLDHRFIIPISEADFQKYDSILPDIDQADQSILIAVRKLENDRPIVLTDDGELLAELVQTKRNVMNLPIFLLMLIRAGIVSKNIGAKCLKFWVQQGRYNRKNLKQWNLELQKIQ